MTQNLTYQQTSMTYYNFPVEITKVYLKEGVTSWKYKHMVIIAKKNGWK